MQAIEQPRQADDPPSDDYSAPVSYSRDRGVQSTSSDMPFNNHDWPVPRGLSSKVHLMMPSTNAALLFGSSSSSGMPPFTRDWPMPRRHTGLHPSQMMFSTNAALTQTYIVTAKQPIYGYSIGLKIPGPKGRVGSIPAPGNRLRRCAPPSIVLVVNPQPMSSFVSRPQTFVTLLKARAGNRHIRRGGSA